MRDREAREMSLNRRAAAVIALLASMSVGGTALAQRPGGILKMYVWDNPPSMSMLDGPNPIGQRVTMGVFNNLVMFDQHVKQSSLKSIVPDLATGRSWNEEGTALTLPLRKGVKWHDGKPFTAKDVQYTWDLQLDKSSDKLRINTRKFWYRNLEEVTVNGDYEVTFHLKRPQPAFPMLLASGFAPIYPCHVSSAQMRQHPIGTGPFKFVEFKPNESIKVTRNVDYWKNDRPYLDGIDYTIVPNRSPAILGFIAGKFDMTWPYIVTVPLLKDIKSQTPDAICELRTTNGSGNLLVNRDMAPFDNVDLRRAMALTLDRKPFIDILSEGQAKIGGAMLPPPEGVWGMPPEMLKTLPGYDPDVQKNRAAARAIMQKLGYGDDKRLAIKVAARDIPSYRDQAVILIDQLKEIYIAGELDTVETANWQAKRTRKDYSVAMNNTG